MYVIELKNMVTALYASQEERQRNLRMKMYSLGGVRLRKCSGGRFTVPELVVPRRVPGLRESYVYRDIGLDSM